MERIKEVLSKLYEKHRILIWYDEKEEVRADFEAVNLKGVEKVEIQNNEFGLKYRVLRQAPEQQFLLYRAGAIPDDLENWLLDVQLAYGEFRADQVALWLAELGLGFEFTDIIAAHKLFFKSAVRLRQLRTLLKPDDTALDIQYKMLAVATDTEPRLDTIVESLLAAYADGKDDKISLLTRCKLDAFLWKRLQRAYGYTSEAPSIEDFVITLFKSCYALELGEQAALGSEALLFVKRWKDSTRHQKAFEIVSVQIADVLNIEADLIERAHDTLGSLDLFELVDRRVVQGLVHDVVRRTLPLEAVVECIRLRRKSHWFDRYAHLYEAIEAGAALLAAIEPLNLHISSLTQGVEHYAQTWFRIDQLYRLFIYHSTSSGLVSLLESLSKEVENRYTNQFLLKINDSWQRCVDGAEQWLAPGIALQTRFFAETVAPFLKKGKKVVVIISDALRFEAAEELVRKIRQEDRYEAELAPALSAIPSYTQLGMAALLPHKKLSFSSKKDGTIQIDDEPTQGIANRNKILNRRLSGKGKAVRAKDFLKMNREESRALFRENDVVYLYHNLIDKVGDSRDSEHRVFDAVADALEELVLMVKRLAAANASNFLIGADHGFIYQHQPLDESDYLTEAPQGEEILGQDRRFVYGKGLLATPGFKKFAFANAGLDGDLELLFPKSINRLRKRGSGSRYVHGGLSLQEVVVPVIHVNKKRESDVEQVEVDLLGRSSKTITTGQLVVAFFQRDPVTEKRQPRTLTAGFYTQEGELISDTHELVFDFTSENERERELRQQFVLTKAAGESYGQEVILKVLERIGSSTHTRAYKTDRYVLKRALDTDFDL